MHTDTQPTNGPFPPLTKHGDQAHIAQFHAAQLPARLALARWQYGGDVPHLHPGVPAIRAAFYEGVRHALLAWLAGGGVHRPENALEDAPVPKRRRAVPDGGAQQVGTCT